MSDEQNNMFPKITPAAEPSPEPSGAVQNIFTPSTPTESSTTNAAASEKFISTVLTKKDAPASEKTKATSPQQPSDAVQSFLLKKKAQERLQEQERGVQTARRALAFTAVLAFGVLAFFTVRLYEKFPFFKPNLTQTKQLLVADKEAAAGTLAGTQLLHTDLLLAEYAFTFDAFQLKKARLSSPFLTSSERQRTEKEAAQLRTTLVEYAKAARPLVNLVLQAPQTNTQTYLASLRDNLPKAAAAGGGTEKAAAQPEVIREFQHIESARAYLAKAQRFRTVLTAMEAEDVTDQTLTELASLVHETGKHPFAIVAQVKGERLPWTAVIREIDRVTQAVDPLYGRGVLGDLGGIRYSGYTFDGLTKKLTLSGKTKTVDSKNFTLVSNLIDAFEKSSMFRDVSMRSFSKSEEGQRDDASGFVGNLDLTLFIQEGDDARDTYTYELPLP